MERQIADLREELALAQGRAKEAEAAMDRGRSDLERLEDGQKRAQEALDAKNKEVPCFFFTWHLRLSFGPRV